MDMKAIGYGVATFVAASLVMTIIGTTFPTITNQPAAISFVALVPVLAGFVAAYGSSGARLRDGTVGGSVGMLLLLIPVLLIPGDPMPLALFVGSALVYLLLAFLGAAFGTFLRDKAGT